MNRPKVDTLVPRLEEKSSECTLFDFCVILHATHNFSKETLLGRGGFGPVYKGQLPDGMEIAVKRLASHSGQGFTEFQNEVELLAKLQHNNLVKLMGCCIQGEERLLVYEYLPNKSLDFFIFGIAQGLLYLHKHSRLRIIHRDLKASNILLDQDMNPKISDFGLAKNFSSNDTQGSTRRVVGTYGYMSPEYASQGIYSVKSDVFSFGVLLLEILSGKRNSGFHEHEDFLNLLGYSWHLWEGGRCLELLEASIANEVHAAEARRMATSVFLWRLFHPPVNDVLPKNLTAPPHNDTNAENTGANVEERPSSILKISLDYHGNLETLTNKVPVLQLICSWLQTRSSSTLLRKEAFP
uniref:non-specific serine/threonine protein kinase n=1 Tax=Aegilops tauschii TaxID=37682 RepID=R7W9J3_AEGTA